MNPQHQLTGSEELGKQIDTALHPERNSLLIKEHVAEGASYEHIVKRELIALYTKHLAKARLEAKIEGLNVGRLATVIHGHVDDGLVMKIKETIDLELKDLKSQLASMEKTG